MTIIKCPKCGKGHMKQRHVVGIGNERLKLITNSESVKYKRGMSIHRRICSRCGYIGGINGT